MRISEGRWGRGLAWVLLLQSTLLLGCCGETSLSVVADETLVPMPAADPGLRPRIEPASDYGEFPERLRWDGRDFVLNGAGLCEWGFLAIDLYRAALYLERPLRAADAILECDQHMIIHLHFVRSLSREQLQAAFDASVRVNAGEAWERHRPALQQLLGAMQDVGVGDCYSFGVRPGRGLLVQRNGVDLADIRDEPFQRLFVRLYFGDQPPSRTMQRAMIEGGR